MDIYDFNSQANCPQDSVPLRMKEAHGQQINVELPASIFHWFKLFFSLLGNLSKSQLLSFIDQLLTNRKKWTVPMIRELLKEIKKGDVPYIVIAKKDIGHQQIERQRKFAKWGVIYEGKLCILDNTSITDNHLKQLQNTSPQTLVAIKNTVDEQPAIDEVPASQLKIVYFDA